jgi:hypothetical protein
VVSTCQHCGKIHVLVARVKSEILDQIVCFKCAVMAARLHTPGVSGELSVMEEQEENRLK